MFENEREKKDKQTDRHKYLKVEGCITTTEATLCLPSTILLDNYDEAATWSLPAFSLLLLPPASSPPVSCYQTTHYKGRVESRAGPHNAAENIDQW